MAGRSARMRLCGKPYADADEAGRSKAMAVPGAQVVRDCPFCGFAHVRKPRTPPATLAGPRRATGFSARVKLAVRTRAGAGDPGDAECENCGHWLGRAGGQVQHRHARKAGGSRDPVTNTAANGGLLCGTPDDPRTCHGKCEKRDPLMRARGWWIETGTGPAYDPRCVAVTLPGGDVAYLTSDGRYAARPPGQAAAA
jgi:hypothetical protein